jgi:hypothetical protein
VSQEVRSILKAEGLDPGPKRREGSWDEFIKRHAATLWATDFFSKKVRTARGLIDVFVVFFVHVGSRRVYLSGVMAHPDGARMKQQPRNAAMHFQERAVRPQSLLRDNDTKYAREFDAILESEGVEVKKLTRASQTPRRSLHGTRHGAWQVRPLSGLFNLSDHVRPGLFARHSVPPVSGGRALGVESV